MKSWRQAIYAMQSIDSLATGLAGIFVPIYFLTLGYSLPQIFYWFILQNLVTLVLFFVVPFFVQRFGFVKTMFLRLAFLLTSLALLYNLRDLPWGFYPVSILTGAQIAFYWFSVHVIFAKSTDDKALGEQVGNFFALPMLVGLFVPLLGAGITTLFGFKVLFVVSGVTYLASVLPLLFVGKIKVEARINLPTIISYCRRYKKYFGAEVLLNAIGEIEGWLLPIFIYLTFKNIMSIGIVSAFAGLGAVLFTLLVGKFSDKIDKKKILRVGALAMLFIWLARFVAESQIQFYVLSILAGFFIVMITVPFTSIIYRNAKDSHVEDFVIFREIPVAIGRVLLYCFALLVVAQIKWTFLVAAGSYLLMLLF